MDHEIGRLLAGLDAREGSDRAWILVAGDHGEGLGIPHSEEAHGIFLYDETVLVPFLVCGPAGRRDVIVDAPVRTVDIFPTLLDLCEIPSPADIAGVSLAETLKRDATPGTRSTYSETMAPWDEFGWSPLRSIREGRWKWIEAPVPELYDLEEDPAESRNLADREPEVASHLRQRLDSIPIHLPGSAAGPPQAIDPAELDRLAELGYMGSGSRAPLPDRDLRDPKDTIGLRPQLHRAWILARGGDTAEAMRRFEEVLALDPDNHLALREIGLIHLDENRPEEAERFLTRLAGLDGRSPETTVPLAQARLSQAVQLVDEGRERDAREKIRPSEQDVATACDRMPELPDLFVLHAEILALLGREDEAARRLETASRLHPESTELAVYRARILAALGQSEPARRVLERVLSRTPDAAEARALLESLRPR
jgi:Flp pilus assembly protein TadD